MTAPPEGFREDPDQGTLRCPHRDLSCCPACVAEHEAIVDADGAAYWIPDAGQRERFRQEFGL